MCTHRKNSSQSCCSREVSVITDIWPIDGKRIKVLLGLDQLLRGIDRTGTIKKRNLVRKPELIASVCAGEKSADRLSSEGCSLSATKCLNGTLSEILLAETGRDDSEEGECEDGLEGKHLE